MSGQRAHEGVVNVLVDKLQQGPDRALGRPGVGVGAGPAGTVTTGTVRSRWPEPADGRHGGGDQCPGEGKVNIGRDAVAFAGPGAQPVG